MKFIITLILLNSLYLSHSQNMINEKLNAYYNATVNTLKIDVNEYSFNGKIEALTYKEKDYFFIQGNKNYLLIKFFGLGNKYGCNIYDLYVLEGDLIKIKKAIHNNDEFKENHVLFYFSIFKTGSNVLASRWDNEDELIKKQKSTKEYKNE